jgi:DNA polymerase-3 subunit epsilon
MREAIHEYLIERPTGASVRELLDLIFTMPGSDAEFGPYFLLSLLGGDDRFTFESATQRWCATAHRHLSLAIEDANFVVVDLETTGGGPGRGESIIEIGAVKLAGGRVIDTFQALVDPGRPLPRFITGLTGIRDEMLAGQPRIEAVLPAFAEFAGSGVLVAHNASFDRSFLDAAWRAVLGQPVTRNFLCTLRLARRLLPELRKRSLDSLADHYGILCVDRHRALGDARITAEVLFRLMDLLHERGVRRVGEALEFQGLASDGRRFFCMLPRSVVAALPRGPGVYRFSGAGGKLLYIGKAANLQQRVSSYLSNSRGHSGKTLDLIRHIRAVAIDETASELEASLLEAEHIRHLKPPYNVLRKHLPRIAYLKLAVADPLPRLSIATRLGSTRARFFGPFRSRAHAQRVLDTVTRTFQLRTCAGRLDPTPEFSPCLQGQIGCCSRPCNATADEIAYARQVESFLRFLVDDRDDVFDALARRRDALSEQLRFEAAARVQKDIDVARHLRVRQRQMSWIVERQHFVVVQPSRESGSWLIYVVVHGRLVERGSIDQGTDLRLLVERIGRLFVAGGRSRPVGPGPAEVDGTTILAAWLRDRGDTDGYVIPIEEPATALVSTPPGAVQVGGDGSNVGAAEWLPSWAATLRTLASPGADQGSLR